MLQLALALWCTLLCRRGPRNGVGFIVVRSSVSIRTASHLDQALPVVASVAIIIVLY